MASRYSIGVIIGSTRSPRSGPQYTEFVVDAITSQSPTLQSSPSTATLTTIDLQKFALPLFDESVVPSEIRDPAGYDHDHTRAWSAEVSRHDAFVFVTPQYNWGYPAGLKNAIDFLFNEWKGKPAVVVSYGGHGGVKAAAQLQEVLQGCRMDVVANAPALKFPGRAFLGASATGADLGLKGNEELWKEEKGQIVAAFEELLAKLEAKSKAKAEAAAQ